MEGDYVMDSDAANKTAYDMGYEGLQGKRECRERVVDAAIRALGSAAADHQLVIRAARDLLAFIEE